MVKNDLNLTYTNQTKRIELNQSKQNRNLIELRK